MLLDSYRMYELLKVKMNQQTLNVLCENDFKEPLSEKEAIV